MNTIRQGATATVLALALSGCVTTPEVELPEHDPAMTALVSATQSIARDHRQLSMLRQRDNPVKISANQGPRTGPLAQKAFLMWSGDAETLTRSIAEKIGWSFKVTGRRPPVPLVASINARGDTLFDILESVGWQLDTRAGIAIDEKDQVIQFIYVGGHP